MALPQSFPIKHQTSFRQVPAINTFILSLAHYIRRIMFSIVQIALFLGEFNATSSFIDDNFIILPSSFRYGWLAMRNSRSTMRNCLDNTQRISKGDWRIGEKFAKRWAFFNFQYSSPLMPSLAAFENSNIFFKNSTVNIVNGSSHSTVCQENGKFFNTNIRFIF